MVTQMQNIAKFSEQKSRMLPCKMNKIVVLKQCKYQCECASQLRNILRKLDAFYQQKKKNACFRASKNQCRQIVGFVCCGANL